MKVLIVGAGIAGLTAAALLRRQGHRVAVIGAEPENIQKPVDYPITLWPHGARILHTLGLYEQYCCQSTAIKTCVLYGRTGKLLNLYDLAGLSSRFDGPRTISRSKLIGLLRGALCDVDVHDNIRLLKSTELDKGVSLELSDKTYDEADVLIIADGNNPQVTERIGAKYALRDTGWSCLSWWEDSQLGTEGENIEIWSAGCALSAASYEDRTGLSIYLPSEMVSSGLQVNSFDRLESLLQAYKLRKGTSLDGFTSKELTLHPMIDKRHPSWVSERVVLLGDAAISYLPGSETGASMALESAAVLAEELSRASEKLVPIALEYYVRRRKARSEFVQNQARAIMSFKLARSSRYARIRDTLVRFHDMRQLLGPKIGLLNQPI